jgi:hypothetical protein
MTPRNWFEVNQDGLRQLLAHRGPEFALFELVQNSWDEAGVSHVEVSVEPMPGRVATAIVSVTDDATHGFADLTHAWTLYAPSAKKANPQQRGRFNQGDKLVLALADEAQIITTTGSVSFDATGRHRGRRKRDVGSQIRVIMRLTRDDQGRMVDACQRLLPPAHITTTVNGQLLKPRTPLANGSWRATLPTVQADSAGYLRRTRRQTTVTLYEPRAGEPPTLYELGIPVVDLGVRWHVDVNQKVPLNSDRDNVPPAFLRELLVQIANHTAELLDPSGAAAPWVRQALADPRVEDITVRQVMDRLYGRKRVAYDPSDPEANKIATSHGYAVVHGGAHSRGEWQQIRRAGALPPAGQVTPSPKVLTSPDGKPPIPPDQWTPGMRRLASYTQRLGLELLGFKPTVEFQDLGNKHRAWWGNRTITFNLRQLGRRWPDSASQEAVDALLLHEFAHDREADHLDRAFPDEVARLGARLRWSTQTLLNDPQNARLAAQSPGQDHTTSLNG